MKLEVIQPISRSNQPQGKMGGIHYLLLHETNNPCMYTEVLLLLHLISLQTFEEKRDSLPPHGSFGCLLLETACIVQIFIRSAVFTDFLSLSIQKKNKIQGSRVDVDMAGVVPCSSSFPTHPLFPILPRIISHSHKALQVIRKVILELSKMQSCFA